MLIIGKCFQPFELIERIEPFELIFNTKARRLKGTKFFYKTKMLMIGKCFQPFELIERIEPFELIFDTKAVSIIQREFLRRICHRENYLYICFKIIHYETFSFSFFRCFGNLWLFIQ